MLSKIKTRLVNYFKSKFLIPLLPAPIETKRDYVLRMTFLCFGVLCFVGSLIVGIIAPKEHPIQIVSFFFIGCSLPFMPKIFNMSFRAGKTSYAVGKAATTREYIEINQVSSTQYRAKHVKQHDGDVFAIIGGMMTFLFTWMFYALFGPVMLGYKIYKTASLVYDYKRDMSATDQNATKS